MRPVTDPVLLAELESDKPVTDPSLLAELEGPGDFSSVVGGSSTSIAPPDYSGVFRDDAADNDGFGAIALRAIAGRVPDLVANAVELPANANDALTRALGMEPSPVGLSGVMRGALRNTAGAVRDLSYTQDMDAAGYGQPTVSGAELVESLTPSADIGIGERMGRIARFIPETLIASAPDMAATLNPATLAGYIGSRTNEIATNRAANDQRQQVGLGDLAVGGVAAPLEALLERFTTMRLLPQGTSLATPGVREALTRIAKETGLQGSLGGVEEVIPYLGETLGTETGATKQGALESFVGGLVAEGALGGVAKGANEAGALFARGAAPAEAAPSNAIAPEVLARANQALSEAQSAPDAAIAPEPTADLDQLLASIPPEVVAELLTPEAPQSLPAWRGGENVQAPPVAPQKAEAVNAAPYQAPAAIKEPASTEATQTPEQSGQVPAEQSAPAPSGADLVLPAKALRDEVTSKAEPSAPTDDTPDPPLDIRYGKPRKAPTREELAAREAELRQRYAPAELVEAASVEEASHVDPGEAAEPVTPAVVAEAVQKSADNTPRNLKQSRDWLLSEIDKASAAARSMAEIRMPAGEKYRGETAAGYRERMAAENRQAAAGRFGYVTLDVPGDGKFKVINSREALAEFRKKVEASPGFRERQAPPRGPQGPRLTVSDAERAKVMAEAETTPPWEDTNLSPFDREFAQIEGRLRRNLGLSQREAPASTAPRPSQSTLEQEAILAPEDLTNDRTADNGTVSRPDARGVGSRPDADPARTRQAKLGIESLVRRFGGSAVADSINRSYAETGRAELIGQQIKSDADLAALADVYRNPAFETIRYVYVNDDGNVLGETAVSMREPGTTAAFPDNMGGEDGAQWVMRSAPKGATGVWLLHNHPSGNPTPSEADLDFTAALGLRLGDMAGAPKLRGHVILNHTTYGRITPQGEERPNASITKIGPDPLRNPTGAVDLLNERFVTPSEVAAHGQRIVSLTPENSFGVMLLDAQGRAITLTAIPTEAFGSKRGLALLSRLAKKSGSEAVVIVGRDEQFARATPEQWSAMDASGIVFNAVSVAKDGKTQSLGKGDRFRDRKVGLGNTRSASTVYAERVESPTKLDNPIMDDSDDYRAEHEAPMKDSGAPAHDITGGGDFYPADVYGPNGLRYYGTGEDRMDAEAYAQIRRVQGRPNNYVTIYRAVPKSVKGSIRAGDWVTTVRAYAVEHGRGALNGDYKIQKKLVRANEIFTNGDSWLEWGYDPQPLDQEYERAKRARRAAKNSTSVESGTNLDMAEDRAEDRRKELASLDQTDTPEFKRWFGNSRAVDENGKPLVVYHGTTGDFDTFKPSQKFGDAYFASESTGYANALAYGDGGNVMPLYVSLQNPLEVPYSSYNADTLETAWVDNHDGLIATDEAGVKKVVVAFSPNQIKSATANRGTFDPKSPSILESSTNLDMAEDRAEDRRKELASLDQTETPEFRNWFAGSKVVDENGEPLRVFHGTAANIDAFSNEKLGSATGANSAKAGHWFAANPEVSTGYANYAALDAPVRRKMKDVERIEREANHASIAFKDSKWGEYDAAISEAEAMEQDNQRNPEKGQNIIPVFLSIQNPIELDAEGAAYADFQGEIGRAIRAMKATQPFDRNYIDGIIIRNLDDHPSRDGLVSDHFLVREPTQIKSATANRGTFDPDSPNILESGTNLDMAKDRAEERRKELAATLPASRGTPGWNYDFNRWEGRKGELKRARADLQDKMLAWRDAQDQLAAADRIVEDAANVYRIENLMHGRVAEGMDRIERQQVEPLVAAMKDAGVKADTLEEYLYARHAKERNRQIASINGSMPDGGSGMTNAEADAILAKADKTVLEPLAKRVDAITKATRKRMLDHGLISQEQFDAMEAQYQHYVPLRGKQTRDFEADMRGGGTGRGVDGRGKPIKQAFGRGKDNRAVNILGEVVGDAQRSIILAEKARVGRAVMRLVLANPNPALWEVEPVQTERALDANGEVYERVANDWSDPSVVAVRHKGQLYRVQFTNIELAKALNNVGVDQLGTITRWAGKINRYFSAVLTKYNPAFVPVNATRDALFGLAGLAAEHGEAAALDAALHYPQAARAAFRQAQGKTGTGQWDQWVSEFAAAGGKTGYVAMPSAEDLARQIGKGALGGNAIERTVKPVLDLVGQVNDAVENALRLSAYVTLRKRGTSADAAAEYAKNLTVNFNRKGFSGSKLNAWFLFYNAALQGAHRTSKLLRSPKAMAYVGALAGAQVAAAMFAMGLEDDDGEPLWNKIPDHVKRRNLVIALPGGTVVTVPMPYGFNLFTYTAGRLTGAVLNQEDKPTDRAGAIAADVLSAATESFMPVPIGEGSLGMLPTVLRIPVNVQTNRNDFGRPIRRESGYSKSDVPLASLGKPDTLEVFKLGASGLNRIGGGDRFTPPPMSWFDRAPEDLEYLLGELTGGTGKFITDVATVGQQAAGGDLAPKLQPKDIPITKRFVTNIDEQAAQASLYYERRETLDRSLKRVRAAFKEQGEEAAVKLLESSPELKGATFKRRKNEGKNGDPAGSIITTDGNPQIIPSDPDSVFALYREAEKEGQSANESIEDAFGKTPGAIFANDETRKRDASVRVYRTGKQRAQNAFNAAWLRDVVGATE